MANNELSIHGSPMSDYGDLEAENCPLTLSSLPPLPCQSSPLQNLNKMVVCSTESFNNPLRKNNLEFNKTPLLPTFRPGHAPPPRMFSSNYSNTNRVTINNRNPKRYQPPSGPPPTGNRRLYTGRESEDKHLSRQKTTSNFIQGWCIASTRTIM